MRETLLTGDPTSPMIFGKSLPCCFFVVLLKEMQSELLLGKAPLEERAARNQPTVRAIFIFRDTFLPQFFKFLCSHSIVKWNLDKEILDYGKQTNKQNRSF